MTKRIRPTYQDLEKRLALAEPIAAALKHHEVDAVVGEKKIAFLLLRDGGEASSLPAGLRSTTSVGIPACIGREAGRAATADVLLPQQARTTRRHHVARDAVTVTIPESLDSASGVVRRWVVELARTGDGLFTCPVADLAGDVGPDDVCHDGA